jgi:hypothetical protein
LLKVTRSLLFQTRERLNEFTLLSYATSALYQADQWHELAGIFPTITCMGFATSEALLCIGHDKSLTVVSDTFRGTAASGAAYCLDLGRPYECTFNAINMVRGLMLGRMRACALNCVHRQRTTQTKKTTKQN